MNAFLDLNAMKYLEIIRPDDWHVHFRDSENLINTVPATAKTFSRALVMPNLVPPVTTLNHLIEYRTRILHAIPDKTDFTPYMTLYLNEQVQPTTLIDAKQHDFILGAKLYPANVTTHAEAGTRQIKNLYPLLDVMQSQDLVLQVHGEAVEADIFDRETQFIEKTLLPITQNFPKLRMVLEHISTKAAVDFIKNAAENLAATITPHHLMYNRNDLLTQGIKPHLYCLPILKRQSDQLALQQAAMSGNPKFFAGTDSAPHAISQKESACGCAGIFSAPYALAIYAQLFDANGQLDKLENFMSRFGALFYKLPINQSSILLKAKTQMVPMTLSLGKGQVSPIAAGQTLAWSVDDIDE
jgi:dihydroorotase